MKVNQPQVCVVIVNWNLRDATIACVASVLAGDYAGQQVLVVDNGSTDDSASQLRLRFGDRLEVIEAGRNLFYGGGNNLGIKRALATGADLVLILNNDTLVAPDMVGRLVRTAMAYPGVGILSPMIYFGRDLSRIWAMGSRRRWWLPLPTDVGRGEIDRGQYGAPLAMDYVTGCAMMVRREVFTRAGFLDPAYRMYYEDADFCVRAQRAGFGILVEPRAKMWHTVAASANRELVTSRYQRTRYRVRFYRQHPHGPLAWLVHPLLWAEEIARAGLALMQGQPDLARAGWRGLRDGYREKMDE